MKINELRIGNLIKYNDEIILVAGIVRNIIYYNSDKTDTLNFDSNNNGYEPFKPIELTEDWLLKLGFEKHFVEYPEYTEIYHIMKNRFIIEFTIENWQNRHNKIKWYCSRILNNLSNPLLFIHQLQNLYYILTGNELTIKL